MAFDLYLTIPENSPVGQIVQSVVTAQHITPEQAVNQLLSEVVHLKGKRTPAQELIGAFSKPEDAVLIDDSMEVARRLRAIDAQRHFDV